MKSLKEFLHQFLNNKGHHVFVSLLISKICAFLTSIFIIQIFPASQFGKITLVISILALFTPFNGFGSTQSLLRFGSLEDNIKDKDELSSYLFAQGFFYQLIISVLFLIVGLFYAAKFDAIFWIFLVFAVRIIGLFIFSHIQSDLRVRGDNAAYAKVGNAVNSASLLLVIAGSYFYGIEGYVVAMGLSPFISLFWMKNGLKSFKSSISNFSKKEIWSYAFHSSGTAFLSDALFSLDILLLGYFSTVTEVANYKVAILIPANCTFLALSFMQSDFPLLAKNYQDKIFLKKYIFNYLKLFLPICIGIFAVGYLAKTQIIELFFGSKYNGIEAIFAILLATFCGNMLLRNLFGNLLSAVGLMKANTYVSLISVLLFIGLAFGFSENISSLKMAFITAFTLSGSGFMLLVYFLSYYKKLK